LINFEKILKNKKIFVTGHTGFTGSWVCLWLQNIGSKVLGYSLPPHTSPSLFKSLGLDKTISSIYEDIGNYKLLKNSIIAFQPDIILHLAAQPLVSKGYEEPLKTFNTNIMGTANILEISKYIKSLKGILCVTTDKVYKNNENQNEFVETDILGGLDPYSASKSATEIVIESFAKSYFLNNEDFPVINVARGGNIIGGGDWSQNRLFPDYVRSITSNKRLIIRSSSSIRPWQHVFDLISGYFSILASILDKNINKYTAWNLGPHEKENYSVENILHII
jgi:CDP-glucose 4,6-dehydratase